MRRNVTEGWDNQGLSVLSKIELVGRSLDAWGREKFGDFAKKIADAKALLQRLQRHIQTEQVVLAYREAEKALDDLLKQQEIAWSQRSRANCLKLGDRNTRFFHTKATQRKKRNLIEKIHDDQGRKFVRAADIARVLKGYFQNIFSTSDPVGIEDVASLVDGRVTDAHRRVLSLQFSRDEVEEALFQMHPTKAPVLNGETSSSMVNQTLLVLIPKVKKSVLASQFRPISLCNVIFKIITKTIANIMKLILHNLICEAQNAFVPGRLITDHALIAFECFHYMKKRISGRNDDSFLFARATVQEAECIKSIMETYERASGQLLGVKAIDSYDKYLGLPTIIGKSKSRIFSFKERVWKKLKGWKEQTLSRADREVLIKAVAQAIPSYVMSCFILPDGLCEEIESMISRFYWGGDVTRRGIHWTNWKTLYRPKRMGVLALETLNPLIWPWWRIQNYPESLMGRVFKAVNFPSGKLIDAKKGYRPSYAWSSILKTSSMIQEGSCWRIGDGKHVRIWEDNWLPSGPPINFRQDIVDEQQLVRVAVLLLPNNGGWNIPLVEWTFCPTTAARILAIPIRHQDAIDCLFWMGTADGVYTVKTGYEWLQKLANQNCPSSSNEVGLEPLQWAIFLKAPSLPRVREVVWRVCTGAVQVRAKLRRRGVDVDPSCPLCGLEDETMEHLFLGCNVIRGCWFASNLSLRFLSGMKVAEFMGWVVSEMELEVVDEVKQILFAMWEARNKLIF
ncbi:uncharacterized protein LOC130725161 [Lotus japonicus]|uniref:uncharacterized protein LOC130725161 n=1 Tax=Lotus japonicus TaxID=34305 RepID=UPI00258578B6|nr:uncharacterized protein LOC130725161 [Lotus japonicus]